MDYVEPSSIVYAIDNGTLDEITNVLLENYCAKVLSKLFDSPLVSDKKSTDLYFTSAGVSPFIQDVFYDRFPLLATVPLKDLKSSGLIFKNSLLTVISPEALPGISTEVLFENALPVTTEALNKAISVVNTSLDYVDLLGSGWLRFVRAVIRVIHFASNPYVESCVFSVNTHLGKVMIFIPYGINYEVVACSLNLVHESVHQMLYLAEDLGGSFTWSKQACHSTICSPWTGRELTLYSFSHACIVWYCLSKFLDRLSKVLNTKCELNKIYNTHLEVQKGFALLPETLRSHAAELERIPSAYREIIMQIALNSA